MSINLNDLRNKFDTQVLVSVATGTSSIAINTFSVQGDVVTNGWTNSNNVPAGEFVLECDFTTAPAASLPINLYSRLLSIEGSGNAPQPTLSYSHQLIGVFLVDAVGTSVTQFLHASATLPSVNASQVYEFYIENATNQAINAGWKLFVTPKTIGPL